MLAESTPSQAPWAPTEQTHVALDTGDKSSSTFKHVKNRTKTGLPHIRRENAKTFRANGYPRSQVRLKLCLGRMRALWSSLRP